MRVDSDTKKPDRRAVPHHSKARAWCSDMLGPREPGTRAGDQRVGDCCLDLLRAEGTFSQKTLVPRLPSECEIRHRLYQHLKSSVTLY